MELLGKHRLWGSFLLNNYNVELLGFAYYSHQREFAFFFVSASGMLCPGVVCLKCVPGPSVPRCGVPTQSAHRFRLGAGPSPGTSGAHRRARCNPTAHWTGCWDWGWDEVVEWLGEWGWKGRGTPRGRRLLAASRCFKWRVSLCKSSYNPCAWYPLRGLCTPIS